MFLSLYDLFPGELVHLITTERQEIPTDIPTYMGHYDLRNQREMFGFQKPVLVTVEVTKSFPPTHLSLALTTVDEQRKQITGYQKDIQKVVIDMNKSITYVTHKRNQLVITLLAKIELTNDNLPFISEAMQEAVQKHQARAKKRLEAEA